MGPVNGQIPTTGSSTGITTANLLLAIKLALTV
jgi:hypothetical protein